MNGKSAARRASARRAPRPVGGLPAARFRMHCLSGRRARAFGCLERLIPYTRCCFAFRTLSVCRGPWVLRAVCVCCPATAGARDIWGGRGSGGDSALRIAFCLPRLRAFPPAGFRRYKLAWISGDCSRLSPDPLFPSLDRSLLPLVCLGIGLRGSQSVAAAGKLVPRVLVAARSTAMGCAIHSAMNVWVEVVCRPGVVAGRVIERTSCRCRLMLLCMGYITVKHQGACSLEPPRRRGARRVSIDSRS